MHKMSQLLPLSLPKYIFTMHDAHGIVQIVFKLAVGKGAALIYKTFH